MKIKGIILFYVAMQCMPRCVATTLQQMQDLYKNIGDDLMCIRKEFSATQPKVYAVLDRIDKMYNLAKIAAEKKNKYKDVLKNQGAETQKLYEEIAALKTKLSTTESELMSAHKSLEDAAKAVQDEKDQALKLSREKSKISKEQHELQMQVNKLKSDKEKKPEPKELLHEIKQLKGLSEEETALLNQAQSLSLSSTSAPSSPR